MATYTTTNAPLPWMEPYLQDYMSRAQEVANAPYQASPQTYTGPNNLLTQGWNAVANRAMQGSPVMSQANQQLQNTMGGGFLNRQASTNPYLQSTNPYAQMGNPYLSQSIADAQGDLVRSYNQTQKPAWDKAMQSSGSFGNTGVMEMQQNSQNDLMRNLGRIGTDMRMGAYNQQANLMENQVGRMFNAGESQAGRQDAITGAERSYQQAAMGMAPQFANQDYVDANNLLNAGQQRQAFDQGQADQNFRWWQEAQNYPLQRLQAYGNALGAGQGGTQTQNAPDPSTASQLLGGGLTGAAIYKTLFGG